MEITITITLDRYNELIKKEVIYDMQKEMLENDKYANDTEKLMYGIKEKGVDE